MRIPDRLTARLYEQAHAARWNVSQPAFAAALERSASKAFQQQTPNDTTAPDEARLDRYCSALHLDDLALACACAEGHDAAWDHFVREFRPVLYRAVDALAPGGGARELADSIYADLYGLDDRNGTRRSLFRYFHGRSSLATWLRAVLAQRHVDRVRAERRLTSIEEDDTIARAPAAARGVDPDARRYLALVKVALARAVASLPERDRLRLGCYYREELTLAQTGRLLGEHEATVSRQLARTRRSLRDLIERHLRDDHGLGDDEIARCFECTIDDPGHLDVAEILGSSAARKNPAPERSL
ncbi:MAG TPA: sigma-70 family RNA polymerase sigma factor [Vicinamibacterales bacterium]|nr:sigma-70 family RNA polymerase sigma factor [Vicinamibacterales bacterium]